LIFDRGWEASQVERDPPQPGEFVRCAEWNDSFVGLFFGKESIDRVRGRYVRVRNGGMVNRLQRPEILFLAGRGRAETAQHHEAGDECASGQSAARPGQNGIVGHSLGL
jgi:hypothetical protein